MGTHPEMKKKGEKEKTNSSLTLVVLHFAILLHNQVDNSFKRSLLIQAKTDT